VKSVKAQSAKNYSQFHFAAFAAQPSADPPLVIPSEARGLSVLKDSHRLISRFRTISHLALRALLSLRERIEVRVRWEQRCSEIRRFGFDEWALG